MYSSKSEIETAFKGEFEMPPRNLRQKRVHRISEATKKAVTSMTALVETADECTLVSLAAFIAAELYQFSVGIELCEIVLLLPAVDAVVTEAAQELITACQMAIDNDFSEINKYRKTPEK